MRVIVRFLKEHKKTISFHVVFNILFALLITSSSYYHTPLNFFKDRIAYTIHLCVLQSSFAGFIYIISLSKTLFKFVFPLLFLILGFISFWVYSIDISMSPSLIDVALSAKFYIVKDLLTLPLLMYMFILIVAIIFLWKFYKKINPTKGFVFFVPLSLLCISIFFYVDTARHRSLSSKLPYSFFYSLKEYFFTEDLMLKEPENVVQLSTYEDIKVVLILGESVRADHLSVNGYKRITTPFISSRKNVISYRDTYTSYGNTLQSIPQILTDESVYGAKKDSVYTIYSQLEKVNIPTFWIGNQLLEKSYKQIVKENLDVTIIDELKSFYSFHKKQDLELLPILNDKIKSTPEGLFSIHMIGSHWWYEDKYSEEFRKFKPVIDSKYIPSQSKEQMLNSYDNTILYLDNFLEKTIRILEKDKVPIILIYVSDHGESLGENGKWLHGDYKSLTRPAIMVWYSDTFKNRYPNKVESLIKKENQPISTNIIYHSILELFQIEGFDNEESIFH